MERRKFMIGVGSLAAGGAAATGTGAFTTASVQDRTVNVEIDSDSGSQVALIAGDAPGIQETTEGELKLDLTGPNDEGVNSNSVYVWGDNPDGDAPHGEDPSYETAFAFKIVNQGRRDYSTVGLTYEFDDTSWQEDEVEYVGASDPEHNFIQFSVYSGQYTTGGLTAPSYSHGTTVANNNNILESLTGSASEFRTADELYVVVEVNTSGEKSSDDQKLSGKLTLNVEDPIN